VNRTRVWLVVSPVVAAGVLTAHSLAYRLTGTAVAPLHSYLEHAPQVLLMLALCGLVFGLFGGRLDAPPAWLFPVVAVASFVGQEQLERLAHGEWTASFVASPVFLVGLVLQLPVAFLAWVLARWLLAVVGETEFAQPRSRPQYLLDVAAAIAADVRPSEVRTPPGRAPPWRQLSS
jgi:hypothetical protein